MPIIKRPIINKNFTTASPKLKPPYLLKIRLKSGKLVNWERFMTYEDARKMGAFYVEVRAYQAYGFKIEHLENEEGA